MKRIYQGTPNNGKRICGQNSRVFKKLKNKHYLLPRRPLAS